jgi:hypothetical protein
LKLAELAAAVGVRDYKAMSIAIRRYERKPPPSKSGRALLNQACKMSNVQMYLNFMTPFPTQVAQGAG